MGTDVEELEKSIRTIGLIAPLVVSKDKKILAGGRRYQALLNLGFTEAPVMVVDKDELERELISIDENLVRKNLNKVELEGNLRRAKEIYQALNPESEFTQESEAEEDKKEVLPAQKFLDMVSEKTGFSARQIHQAIDRDEKASDEIKEARRNGELAISHTNEIIKLDKEHQTAAQQFIDAYQAFNNNPEAHLNVEVLPFELSGEAPLKDGTDVTFMRLPSLDKPISLQTLRATIRNIYPVEDNGFTYLSCEYLASNRTFILNQQHPHIATEPLPFNGNDTRIFLDRDSAINYAKKALETALSQLSGDTSLIDNVDL
jgi:ParB-like chromosome segregation protein Spo0J